MAFSKILGKLQTSDHDFKEIVSHSSWALILFALAAVMQFVFDLLLARNFGAAGAGLFYLGFSVLVIFSLIGRLGFNRAVVKYMPAFIKNKDWERVNGLRRTALSLTLLVSAILSALIFALAPLIVNKIFNQPQLLFILRAFALAITPMALIYVQAGLLRGFKLTKESVFLERVAYYALSIPLLLILGKAIGLNGAVIGFTLSVFITAVIGALMLKKAFPRSEKLILFSKKTLLLVAAPLLFVEFSNQMTGQLNIVILGALVSPEAVGVFNVAVKVSMLVSIILTGINTIATTKIAELYSNNDHAGLESMASKTAGFALLCGAPLMILLLVFPEFVLGFFGNEFTGGATVLRILIVAQVINLGVGSVAQILAMTGHERILAISIVGSTLVLNAVLSILLIPGFGIIGAGVAVAVSIAAKNIILLYLVKKHLNIWSLPFKAVKTWLKNI